ncbi:MAG: acetate kinase [Verrucomicrobia bacterium]|nr:acetate kinase [Verrucomicrobiota bacterium]
MKILVANLGSTSLKWRLFAFNGQQSEVLHKGGLERVTDYPSAINDCLGQLKEAGAIQDESELTAVGFKTVLAQTVSGCVELTDAVLQDMEGGNLIAPAHNPPYLTGIRLFAERMPQTPLVGLFETAFYQWIPETAKRYGVPHSWHQAGVRRWGFHGASHKFMAERSAELCGREDIAHRARQLYVDAGNSTVGDADFRVISCHLGGSSSVTGIRNGIAIGNSMGLSPQSGLPHNNRVGDLDAMAIPFMMQKKGLTLEHVIRDLCSEGGLKGVSGGYNDLRDIQSEANKGNEDAQLALDFFVAEVRRWIGAYYLELNGIDALVFTAGIGENQASMRTAICENLGNLGVYLDPEANESCRATEAVISHEDSPVKIMVIPTNEELVVAREVKRFLEKNS